MIPLERVEQDALVEWLSYHPVLKDYYFKTNNEGKRTSLQGCRLKKMGLRPGVSDLFIYYPTKTYHGLFLEIKRNRPYSLSEKRSNSWLAQDRFLEIVQGIGYFGAFCYGWEEGVKVIEEYLLS